MKETTPAVFIRRAHRWSGIALIVFVGMKLLSGFRLSGVTAFPGESAARWMHFSKLVDVPLLFLFVFHSAYGILKIIMAKGVRYKVRTFAIANIAALAVFLFFVRFLL